MVLDSFFCKMRINGSRNLLLAAFQLTYLSPSPILPFMGKTDSILFSDTHSPSGACLACSVFLGASAQSQPPPLEGMGSKRGQQQWWNTSRQALCISWLLAESATEKKLSLLRRLFPYNWNRSCYSTLEECLTHTGCLGMESNNSCRQLFEF